MLGVFIFILNVVLVLVNTIVCSVVICLLGAIKSLVGQSSLSHQITRIANRMMWFWATLNYAILHLFNKIEWQIEGGGNLSQKEWYLVISNHMSWSDIVVHCCVFKDRIPMPKFFLKQQLFYVPFIGIACWALDMPFMRRYSHSFLLKNPHLRGDDLKTTQRSCARFKHTPTTVVNYVEGTRYSKDKHKRTPAEYLYLMPPKSGGIAYTLAAMGEQFDKIIDVTLAYPDNRENPFKDMLMGKMGRIVVRINTYPLDEQVLGDYFNDKKYKREFQLWLSRIWREKDSYLATIYQSDKDNGEKNKER